MAEGVGEIAKIQYIPTFINYKTLWKSLIAQVLKDTAHKEDLFFSIELLWCFALVFPVLLVCTLFSTKY